jgi:DNA-binding beta-propeller fold protein YncE
MLAAGRFASSRKSHDSAVMSFLRAVCAVAEGSTVAGAAVTQTVAAVLGDPGRRLCVFGARVGMPRSLGSVTAASITRFLGGFRGVASGSFCANNEWASRGGVALTRDGTRLLVSNCSDSVYVFSVATGEKIRTLRAGTWGTGRLEFWNPHQVWIADDDFVFVADSGNQRIQILTPHFEFHGFAGERRLCSPVGVCANDLVIVASEWNVCVSVLCRRSDAVLRRIESYRCGGHLDSPRGLCFVARTGDFAVADCESNRISVFALNGEFRRHIGEGLLKAPTDVACFASGDELVVADNGNCRVVVLGAAGEVFHELVVADTVSRCTGHDEYFNPLYGMGNKRFSSVAVRGDTVVARADEDCIVFT